MNEKTDSKWLSLATVSILGQPPSSLIIKFMVISITYYHHSYSAKFAYSWGGGSQAQGEMNYLYEDQTLRYIFGIISKSDIINEMK